MSSTPSDNPIESCGATAGDEKYTTSTGREKEGIYGSSSYSYFLFQLLQMRFPFWQRFADLFIARTVMSLPCLGSYRRSFVPLATATSIR
jgi:hypothetical protein